MKKVEYKKRGIIESGNVLYWKWPVSKKQLADFIWQILGEYTWTYLFYHKHP